MQLMGVLSLSYNPKKDKGDSNSPTDHCYLEIKTTGFLLIHCSHKKHVPNSSPDMLPTVYSSLNKPDILTALYLAHDSAFVCLV